METSPFNGSSMISVNDFSNIVPEVPISSGFKTILAVVSIWVLAANIAFGGAFATLRLLLLFELLELLTLFALFLPLLLASSLELLLELLLDFESLELQLEEGSTSLMSSLAASSAKASLIGDDDGDDDGSALMSVSKPSISSNPIGVAVGDEVIYGKYGGMDIEFNGEEVKILRESDILAII